METPDKLFDRTTEEENVRNRLCFLVHQPGEPCKLGGNSTISFSQTKVTSTCRGGRYEHFNQNRFFIGVTDHKKSKSEVWFP
ncbi:uncharacterized protein DS421_18g623430 [Arachis hypogaea]|nr:uncharacterized protein DS421_18g623430 [Arachis hypogaea]